MVQEQADSLTARHAAPTRSAAVAAAVIALTALALVLRLSHLGDGLPFPFHSDSFQIEQAASLLRHGWFVDSNNYPHGLVYVYAAVAWLAFAAGQLVGAGGDWSGFVERFADPAVHQLVGRAVSVAAGALLVPAVYRLARVRFSRGVALLAAAAIALDPAQVLTAHQTRPHVPVVLLLVLAATPVLRLLVARESRGTRTALAEPASGGARLAAAAGVALGLAASIFHLGLVALMWAGLLVALRLRPPRRAVTALAGMLLGFLLVWGALGWLMGRPDVARPLPGRDALAPQTLLGVVSNMREWAQPARVPGAALNWIASSPALFAGAALFALAALRRRALRENLLLYGSFPLVVFVVMATFVGSHARYALAATPFLAVLAAAACLTLGPAWWRALAGSLLLLLPLAGTTLYLRLLTHVDSRLSVALLLPELTAAGASVALQDRLVVDRSVLGPKAREFPPHDSLDGLALGDAPGFAPRLALRDSGANLYLRATGSQWSRGPLAPVDLETLGFRLYGQLRGGTSSTIDLPDLPDRFASQLLHATRPGPTIEVWAKPEGRAALETLVPAERLAEWTGAESPQAAVEAVLAQRGGAASGGASASVALSAVRADIDGDGVPEDVGSNVDSVQLAKLLALPTAAWRDAGSARAGERAAPKLSVRGRPVNGEPVLLLLSGASAGGSVRWSVRVATDASAGAGGTEIPMPDVAAGPSGGVALAALWPKDAPGGTTVTVQAFVADAGAPQGVAASNAMTATSPR